MVHLMKQGSILGLLALLLGLGSLGCGNSSSSAPPVSIEAPVVGRVTVSSPDDEGLSLVTGDVEAVTADSTILVINEENSNLALQLWNRLIPNALAQSFPARCSNTGHACAQADEDGAFTVEIEAEEDDFLRILVISVTTGNDLSDETRKQVPRNFIHFASQPLDVAVDPEDRLLYVLFGGNETTGENGRIVRLGATPNTRTHFDFDGTGPTRILMDPTQTRLLLLDEDESFAAVVDPDQNNFDNPLKISLSDPPVDAVFESSGTIAWITLNGSDNAIAVVDLEAGTVLQQISLDSPFPIFDHDHSVEIDHAENNDGDEIIVVSSGFRHQVNDTLRTAVSMIDVATRTVLQGPRFLAAGVLIRDVAFTEEASEVLIADPLRDVIQEVLLPEEETDSLEITTVSATNSGAIQNPRRIAISAENNLAFVTAKNGTTTRPDTILTVDLDTAEVIDITPVGLNPGRLIWDAENEELFVTCLRSRSVTRLPLSTLLPGNPDLF